MTEIKKRLLFSASENSLPLFIESIGYNPQEEDFARPEGYPYYHWLQTIEGKGSFSFGGQEYILDAGKGVLLMPFTPHSYYSIGEKWSTVYVTFTGAVVEGIMESLDIDYSALYEESKEEKSISKIIYQIMDNIDHNSEFSRLDSSELLYKFMVILKKHKKIKNQHSISHYYDKLRPIVVWLEENYAEDIGLQDMVEQAGISSQYLTTLFREAFKMSPYSFLIQLRIREAKKRLITHNDLPLNYIASSVGFNDTSNFIATFKRIEGITPKKYTKLFMQNSEVNKDKNTL
ncbi:AraC family transcriptional regulator [Bacillus suaedae]|uniref:AraC family transcriptional regulator n=1 Tax=Halalkalibacter suaedae TaxID=2822140 RepID=A0A940WVL4_9BACI|nr:AraC family transcriptional regulator [Bacillus suaedae]MBP3952538.1 AraC family transcriptional regulator [Bacillus suaedae]